MTKQELALKSTLSERAIYKLLGGEALPSFATLVLLSRALSIEPSDLLLEPEDLEGKLGWGGRWTDPDESGTDSSS
jgi:transcriptional regulator with XRE-family HTH domain